MPITVTTALPDAQQPTLGNGVEDAVDVDWTPTTNYGAVRVEYRTTTDGTADAWQLHAEIAVGASQTDITGLPDGEQIDVRIRTQTEHVTGAWTAIESITTQFPGAANLRTTTVGQTSVALAWDDNADNEDGFRVIREEKRVGSWTAQDVLKDLDPNMTSITDDTVRPSSEYRYRIEAYTEDAQATSNVITVTTSPSGLETSRVPSSGWYVEVDHPSGRTLTPQVVGSPVWSPVVRGQPQVRIPVARNDKWLLDSFDDADIRVWKDGRKLPIDTLKRRSHSDSATQLIATGGEELTGRVQAEFDIEEIHTAAETLVETHTGYVANVDAPDTTTEQDVQVAGYAGATDLENALLRAIPATSPLKPTANGLSRHPVADPRDALYSRDLGQNDTIDGDAYNRGQAWYGTSPTHFDEFEISFGHDIPADRVGIKIRDELLGGSDVDIRWDGTTIDSVTGTSKSLGWTEVGMDSYYSSSGGYQQVIGQDLTAGQTYTLQINVQGSSQYVADLICVYDTKYPPSFPNPDAATNAGGTLSAPTPHPGTVNAVFDDVETVRAVVGGQVTVTMDDTSGDQAIALSNDFGTTWTSATNTSTLDTSFASAGGSLRVRVSIGSYGTQSTFPTDNTTAQELTEVDLFADLEDTPLVINERFDDSLESILATLADRADAYWEVAIDDGQISIEWAQSGQRSSTLSASSKSFEVERQTADQWERIVVKGSPQRRSGERVVADSGNAVSLDHDNLLLGKEAVIDPDTGQQFVSGVDYELDASAGTLTATAEGALDDGVEFVVDYEYETKGSYGSGSATAQTTKTVDIPGLSTDRACGLAALVIFEQVNEPLQEGTLSISDVPAGWSVLEEIDPDVLPDALGPWQPKDVEASPGGANIRLGSRDSVGDVVGDIRSRVSAVSRRA
ncbi:hypothetical protein DEQ92_20240 [Haloferax sp. Atlit-6N]|uniref:fibronectin type III domain-containing protein n=1 Tax=Haloferax sp. Atlit-6N TaxID=2077205 RepID=UPI000E22F27B|nr:fibronectin type III domain-containing protein [Haloferax sp. Atlit-6N]REA00185.1 hypothetical protein DEQ92_20240 [Haloferax sp. Atlit-6N]